MVGLMLIGMMIWKMKVNNKMTKKVTGDVRRTTVRSAEYSCT